MTHGLSGCRSPLLLACGDCRSLFCLGDSLVAAGFSVIEVVSTDEALSHLESRSDIHLVAADIDMPGCCSGLALARFVSRRWPHIPGLVLGWPTEPILSLPDTITFMPQPVTPAALVEQVALTLHSHG
ncbi:response regulator [Methylobacterium oxalidis]|uniref:response regulator n=1 Tax=Methylobacterium oxalidis TaxID=944322 RepID=UPI003314E5E9